MANLLEGQVAAIVESDIRCLQGRVEQDVSAPLFRGLRPQRAHLFERIAVLHIEGVAVNHEDVFKTVEVHVQEDRLPRPLGRVQTA